MYTLTYKGFISAIKNICLNKVHTSTNNKNQNDAEYWDFMVPKTSLIAHDVISSYMFLSTRLENDNILSPIHSYRHKIPAIRDLLLVSECNCTAVH